MYASTRTPTTQLDRHYGAHPRLEAITLVTRSTLSHNDEAHRVPCWASSRMRSDTGMARRGSRESDTRAWYTLVAMGSRASAKRRVSAITMRLGKGLATLPSSRHVPFGTRMDLAQECDIEVHGRLEPGWGRTRGKDSRLERLKGAECSSSTKELLAEKVEQGS
ncbi:hypothetical protein C8R45DRAFT_929063 [Mycena sanguinolenta]|nr:hypothetical protein C8R45DRAFT_929063 [Mycena sanguinolenta]